MDDRMIDYGHGIRGLSKMLHLYVQFQIEKDFPFTTSFTVSFSVEVISLEPEVRIPSVLEVTESRKRSITYYNL
jgi:hypothetical protein